MSKSSDSSENWGYAAVPSNTEVRRSSRIRNTFDFNPINNESSDSADNGNRDASSDDVDDWFEFFYPPVEFILAKREDRYLVKYKFRSYLHLEWVDEEEILASGRTGRMRLNKFMKEYVADVESDEGLFDTAYTEVDRILNTTEIFPVIHQRTAQMMNERWQGKCSIILAKIMNFKYEGAFYGIPFYSWVTSDNIQEMGDIKYQVDFCMIHNRLFNGYYIQPNEFWKDLGFVFKNAEAMYQDPELSARKASDTLRQMAIRLYQHWHAVLQSEGNDPGPYNLWWVCQIPDVNCMIPEFITMNLDEIPFTVQHEQTDKDSHTQYLTEEELEEVVQMTEVDKIFLVKWRNMSYTDITWEAESDINCPQKVSDYYRFNKSLDNQSRNEMQETLNRYLRVIAQIQNDQNSRNPRYAGNNAYMTQLIRGYEFQQSKPRMQVQQYTQSPQFKGDRIMRDYQVEGLNWLLRN